MFRGIYEYISYISEVKSAELPYSFDILIKKEQNGFFYKTIDDAHVPDKELFNTYNHHFYNDNNSQERFGFNICGFIKCSLNI